MSRIIVVVSVVLFIAGSATYFISPTLNKSPSVLPIKTQISTNLNRQQSEPSLETSAEVNLDSVPEVMAIVEGKKISSTIYLRTLIMIKENIEKAGQKLDENTFNQLKREIVESIINTEALLYQAKKEGINVPKKEVEDRLKKIQSNFQDQAHFEKSITEQGLTIDEFVSDIERGLRINTLLQNKVISKVDVNDNAVKEYYKLNQLEFEEEEKIHAAHIFIKAGAAMSENDKAKAKEKAEGILKQIRAGASFDEIASTENHDEATALRAGDLGSLRKSQFVAQFTQAALTLLPGDISGVVETRFGYHIFKLIDKVPSTFIPFEKVAGQIKDQLENQQRNRMISNYISRLRNSLSVKVFI